MDLVTRRVVQAEQTLELTTKEFEILEYLLRHLGQVVSREMLGLDGFDVRRMAIGAGYDWLIDAGVGGSLLQPRVSWHSLPPDGALARALFPADRSDGDPGAVSEDSALAHSLKNTPGECGWVTFKGIRATAPSMGVAAGAYGVCALLDTLSGRRLPHHGRACLWSPLLPYVMEPLSRDDAAVPSLPVS